LISILWHSYNFNGNLGEEVTAEDFRDTEYKMTVGDLFEDIHAEPLSELYVQEHFQV